jgi:hypothetical protein
MLRAFALAIAVSVFGAQPVNAQFCSEDGFSHYSGNYAVQGKLHGAPYGDAPFWCKLDIGVLGTITTVSCNPVLTANGGVVQIALGGQLQVNPACAVTGHIDVNFSSAIRRRYNVQGRLTHFEDWPMPHFIAIGTNGPISAPLSVMSIAAAS